MEIDVLHEELVKIVDEIYEDWWDELDDLEQTFIADRIDDIECGQPFTKLDAEAIIAMAKEKGIRKLA